MKHLRRKGQLNLADGPYTFISFPFLGFSKITATQPKKKGKNHKDKRELERTQQQFRNFNRLSENHRCKKGTDSADVRIYNLSG
jgi:hypothetical protein